ncbi:MAG: LysE family translocator [Desulfobacter sp.]|nr:MAG: LysE family translocator [Desulfobacter sp.]
MTEFYTATMMLSIASFGLAMTMTPGPNNAMLLSSGLTFGYKRTIPHALGITFGFPVMVICVGMGIGKLFESYPVIYSALKIVGISYLVWMAWHIANTKGSLDPANIKDRPFTFLQAALFQWVNPKAWIAAITSTSAFITDHQIATIQVVVISCIYFLCAILSTNSWALGGVVLRKFIQNEKLVQTFNIIMALLIVGSVIPFVFGHGSMSKFQG